MLNIVKQTVYKRAFISIIIIIIIIDIVVVVICYFDPRTILVSSLVVD